MLSVKTPTVHTEPEYLPTQWTVDCMIVA